MANKILNDSDQKKSTLANFQLFSSHLVCIDGPIELNENEFILGSVQILETLMIFQACLFTFASAIKNLSKLTPFAGGP